MTASLDLRRYRRTDRERVRDLHETALRDAGGYVEGTPEPDLDDVEESYLDDGEFLVGELDGRIVAMGAFRPATGYLTEFLDVTEDTAELKRMRVDPARQRRGFGTAVYDELERRARERGFAEFVLDTTPEQTAARRFFEGRGFDLVERARVAPGEDAFELLFYRTSLG